MDNDNARIRTHQTIFIKQNCDGSIQDFPSFGNALVKRNDNIKIFRPRYLNLAMEYAAGIQKTIEIIVVEMATIKD